MSNEKRLRAKISNQVFGEIKGGVDDAKERGENYANNTTIHLTPKAEIEPVLDEKKGLKTVMTSIGKHADAVEKELEKKFKVNSKETDKEISEFNKDLETLQKNLKNAGSKADEIANRNKELNKVREIKKLEDLDKKDSDGKKLKTFIDLHNNTSYKSDNENLLINGKKQLDIWNQDEEKISNSKKLNVADKAQLTDLSKTQKQLNTLKERQLKIIQDIQGKESKTEKDIIKQYDAAVKLNKILELMSENRTKISDIVSKEYSDNTIANNWTSKTSVPAKVEKYIESLNLKVNDEDDGDNGVEYLKKALTAAYKKGLKDAQAEKDEYIEDKEFKETQAIDPKKVEKAKNQIPQIQEKIFNHEQSLDSQMNNLEQDALKSVEDYLKVADKDNKDTFKKLETALGKIGTYIGSGGELDTINAGLENILKDNHNLGGESEKQKKLFSANLDSLKTTLNSVEDFQETSKKYFEETRFDKQIEIQMDKEVAALQNKIKELHERIETREDYIETGRKVGQVASDNIHVSKAQTNTYIEEQTEIKNGIMNTDVPISIIPEVEPEKFVDEITQQLKGHSAKVDVELNKENITEEIKKVTEMIPDKKVIEVSIKSEQTDKNDNTDVTSTDTKVQKELQEVDKLENDLKAIYQLIDKIELEDIIGENFNTVYAEKDLLNLISLLKEIDKLTGQTSDYSHLTEGYESKYFKPSYFSEFMDGVKPESDEWYDNESVIREAQQLSIISTIGANDVADMYAALLDEIAPTIKSKVEEMFTLDPKALRKHFEDYGGIIKNAIGDSYSYYDLEDKFYSEQNTQIDNSIVEDQNRIQEELKETQKEAITTQDILKNSFRYSNEIKNPSGMDLPQSEIDSIIADGGDSSVWVSKEQYIKELNNDLSILVQNETEGLNKLKEQAKELAQSLSPVSEMADRISKNSSVKELLNSEDFANEATKISKRFATMYDEGISDLEEYATLQYKIMKMFDAETKRAGGVKSSGAKNSTELRTWIMNQWKDINPDFDSSSVIDAVFSNVGTTDFSIMDEITGKMKSMKDTAAEILGYILADTDAKKLEELNTIIGYVEDNFAKLKKLAEEDIVVNIDTSEVADECNNIQDELRETRNEAEQTQEILSRTTSENVSVILPESNLSSTENSGDETETKDENEIPVKVKPKFDADEFIQDIVSKLKGKEVPIDVAPSENFEEFLRRLSTYSEKFDAIKAIPETTQQPTLEGNKQYDNSEEISSMSALKQEVDKVTTSVDEKTNAFREEEQVVTGTVQKEIGELERLSGELVSVRDDIEKITSAITTLPKIDFDVDLSTLNIENIDNASIASFNAFREQLAGLEAQLNVSNLSSKLSEVSNAFETLSKLNLENLNTKNLRLTPITSLIKKSEDIDKLVDTLDALGECLTRLKNDGSFDKDYFAGLKFTPKNVNNMTDMAVALETVGIALQKFDQEAKDALSSINKLVENAEGLKNLNTIISSPKKVKKAQEVIKNEDKSKEPTDAQKRKAETIDRDFVDGKYHDQVEKLTKRYERLNEVIAVSDNRTGDLRQALEDLRNAHTVEDKIKTFEDFKDAIAIVEGELKNLEKANAGKLFTNDINNQLQGIQEQYKNVPYLSNSLTLLVSKIEQIGNEAKDSSADLTELSKKAEDAFTHFKKGMLPTGDVKGNFDSYDKAVEKARELVASYTKVKTELKVPLQLDDNGIAKMTAQVVDLNGQLKNLTFVYNNASKAMVLQTTDMPPTGAQANKVSVINEGIASGKYQQEVNKLAGRYERLKGAIAETENKTEELNTAFRELQNAKSVEEKIEAFERFKSVVANVETKLESLESNVNARTTFANDIDKQFANIQSQYGNVSYLSDSLNTLRSELNHISSEAQESSADLTELGKQAKAAVANFNKGILPSGEEMGNFSSYDKAIAKAKEIVESYSKVKSELKTPLQLNDNGVAKMTAQVIDLNGQLKNLTFVYNDASKAMVQQTTNVRKELTGLPGVIDAIKSKMKDMAVYWTATMFDPYDIINSFRQVADVVIDLNTQMTELAKVSGLSIDQLENRFSKWANTAKDLGATVSDTISATADWSRLGYSVDEAEKLAEVAILYKNVGDGIDIEAANESLVSTMQGFQLEANQAESVIDSFNEVANHYAISSAGIGEALQRSASSFYAANTDLNSAIALITATRLKNWLNIWKHILRIYLIAIEVFITMHHNIEETTI